MLEAATLINSLAIIMLGIAMLRHFRQNARR